ESIKDLFKLRNAYIGLLAKPTGVDIRIILKGKREEEASSLAGDIEEKARGAIGDYIYGVDDETMESVVGLLLKKMGLTLSVAESCTGGLIGHRLTNVTGSSEYIESVLVTYGNRAKTEILGVPLETIKDYGSVSAQTASSMAERAREINRTDLGLAVTGIAGPGGGTPTKPVGLVYTALADGKDTLCRFHHFSGTREEVKLKSSQMALDILRRYLLAGH
ncbi:MAG: nicotinamide-nucleotide amidohydrolase family protein, partial [Nitrospirota bacterium]